MLLYVSTGLLPAQHGLDCSNAKLVSLYAFVPLMGCVVGTKMGSKTNWQQHQLERIQVGRETEWGSKKVHIWEHKLAGTLIGVAAGCRSAQ